MIEEYIHDYIFSGSLPQNASTYVKREADDELYEALQQGKFCYVLNSRQSGKSSLRVRTMSRLSQAGVECASIDLSSVSIQSATQNNWYADLIVKLIDSFVLDIDFKSWWENNQLNSPLMRFTNFLEKHLLVEIEENIVIFIDEIDSVLSLNFPTDDFFAFIRSCYNQRVDNPKYKRLTFCLLGVASPSNLIQDKQRTPFNIGKAISLKGFQLQEVEPLEKGLREKFCDSKAVIKEILNWTGGQPFLTQKLCQFMVEESEKENPCTVEEVARSRIIENWEYQDEPEHLRTIRARIFRDEERAGYLLELYQQIRCSEDPPLPPLIRGVGGISNFASSQTIGIKADNSIEQSELLLSGLVTRREGKLRIYNVIYKQVFDENWVANELKNLCPYSENFKFWVASGGKDESRLLWGKALVYAEEWAKEKNLSYQDKQFLAASREKEIQEKIAAEQREAQLERERKDRKAAEERNLVLSEANKKAKRRISIGSFVLILALVGAATIGISANKQKKQLDETTEEVVAVKELNKLAGKLQNKSNSSNDSITFDSTEALRLSALSFNIDNHQLKQALVSAASSQAHQQLEDSKKAKKEINKSKDFLDKADKKALDSSQGLQTKILFHNYQGNLLIEKDKTPAIEHYTKAFNILKNHLKKTDFTKDNQLLTAKNIESVHRDLLDLKSNLNQEFYQQVWNSLKEHFYARLENSLKSKDWRTADFTTYRLMLFIADREEERYLDIPTIEKFSCDELEEIDKLWVNNSDGNFGFSVQKRIWLETENRLGVKPSDWNENDKRNYLRFSRAVGWYNDRKNNQRESGWMEYSDYMKMVYGDPSKYTGGLPSYFPGRGPIWVSINGMWIRFFLSRCDL